MELYDPTEKPETKKIKVVQVILVQALSSPKLNLNLGGGHCNEFPFRMPILLQVPTKNSLEATVKHDLIHGQRYLSHNIFRHPLKLFLHLARVYR